MGQECNEVNKNNEIIEIENKLNRINSLIKREELEESNLSIRNSLTNNENNYKSRLSKIKAMINNIENGIKKIHH